LAAGKEFIAEDPIRVVVASEQPPIYDGKGHMVQPKKRKLYAQFVRGAAPVHAQQVALTTFSFRKIHQGIAPERWFGYYNSKDAQRQHSWTEDEHDQIVGRLVELGYVQVEPIKLDAPWPAYDKLVVHGQRKIEHVAAKIAEKVLEDGYDVAAVVAYEQQNLNRPEVLAALSALSEEEEPEPLIAA
jgi:hypothetical protein